MATIGNVVAAKASVSKTGTLKLDGKKYEVTEAFSKTMEKLELDGRTALFVLDKDGKVTRVVLNGEVTCKAVETPKYNGDGTYKCDYIALIGSSCNLKDGNPLRFSIRTYGRKAADAEPEATFYELKAWEDIADRARVELAVPEGEKAPKVWAIAKTSLYNGRTQYTAVDYGVIAE